jgi:hypothetical protein
MVYTEEFKNIVREHYPKNPFGLFEMLDRNDYLVGVMLRELDYDSGLYEIWLEQNVSEEEKKNMYERVRDRISGSNT